MSLTAHLNQKLANLLPKGAPFAIAFSGGGDSTALVHSLKDHPQATHVFIIDHNLRSDSAKEAQAALSFARKCGYDAKVITWSHDSPTTGVQEKARQGRYKIMAHLCIEAGVEYLLTAHNQDDQAETVMMRMDRQTDWRGAAGMAEMTYGAIWPAMARLTLVRPLLDFSRQDLRDYNRKHNLSWAEDPSNQNLDYTRIRARAFLGRNPDIRADMLATSREMRGFLEVEKAMLREQFALIGEMHKHGYITLTDYPLPELLKHCLRCVGGQGGSIAASKVKYLLHRMRTKPFFKSATLHGAMVAKYKNGFVICRDLVAVKGRQDRAKDTNDYFKHLTFRLSDTPRVWDGRFLVTGPKTRSYMGSVYLNSENLTEEQSRILKSIAAPARPTLPVSKKENSIRILGAGDHGYRATKSLVKTRLEAALGGKIA